MLFASRKTMVPATVAMGLLAATGAVSYETASHAAQTQRPPAAPVSTTAGVYVTPNRLAAATITLPVWATAPKRDRGSVNAALSATRASERSGAHATARQTDTADSIATQ